jgi:2-methylfumaryl-CoA hydratase
VAPCFAGDTVHAWSEIKDKAEIPGRDDVGALRIVTYATKDLPCEGFPGRKGDGYEDGVILEIDYWTIMPR